MSVMRFTKKAEQKDMQKCLQQHFRKLNIKKLIGSASCAFIYTIFIILFVYFMKSEPPKDLSDDIISIFLFVILSSFVIIFIVNSIICIKNLSSKNHIDKSFEAYLKEHPQETMKKLEEDFSYGIKIKNTEAIGSRSWICPKHIFNVHKNTVNIYSIYDMEELKCCEKPIRKAKYSYNAFCISFVDKNNNPQILYFNKSDCIDIADTIKYNVGIYKETMKQ